MIYPNKYKKSPRFVVEGIILGTSNARWEQYLLLSESPKGIMSTAKFKFPYNLKGLEKSAFSRTKQG